MTQVADAMESPNGGGRSRGPTKPFPSIPLEEALVLPRGILEHSLSGEIQRLILMDELKVSASSSKTRSLISGSFKYGLSNGSYNSHALSVTAAGRQLANSDFSGDEDKRLGFTQAIVRFEPFIALYDKLKDQRLRQGAALHNELGKLGLSDADCPQAAEIFTSNLRYLGLVRDVSGSEHVVSIDVQPSDVPTVPEVQPASPTQQQSQLTVPANVTPTPPSIIEASNEPALHIDIQIHIDSSASSEQIDQIFSSMARHLYRRES